MATHATNDYELLDLLAEEFAARYRRGEKPSLEEYTDKHPSLAEEIRALFPAMMEMEQAEEERRQPAEPPASAEPHLRQVGDYRILREIAHGGMGVVYEAEQQSLGRRVALKILPVQVGRDTLALERFRREARAAAQLHHTNIVPVFDVGRAGDLYYYAMQYIQGQSLDEVIEELRRLRAHSSTTRHHETPRAADASSSVEEVAQSMLSGHFDEGNVAGRSPASNPSGLITVSPMLQGAVAVAPESVAAQGADGSAPTLAVLPGHTELASVESDYCHYFRSVARIGQQTASALAFAHARGIVHRDIKPSNLLLDTAGIVWITDFGLVKTDDEGLTKSGDVLGTVRYMAPERFRGQCDGRSDIYALGLTLYELLVLQPAFTSPDRLRLLDQVRSHEPARPRSLDPRIPRDLETIVLKAMDKDPRRRYQSADEMAGDLRHFLGDEPIRARRSSLLERLLRWCRRNRALALLVLVLVFVAIGSTATALYLNVTLTESEANRRRAEDAEAQARAKVWLADLAQARAWRMSRQPGQRVAGLRAIQDALTLPVPPGHLLDELRTEAIACLCLPDLEVVKEWDTWFTGSSGFALDPAFERYARGDDDGTVSVRRLSDDVELCRLRGGGTVSDYDGLEFSPDGRFIRQICDTSEGCKGRLWKVEGTSAVAVLEDNHHASAFHPDSRQLAAAYPDGKIRIYDTALGKELKHFQVVVPIQRLGPRWNRLRWNPKRPQQLLITFQTMRLLDLDTGRVREIGGKMPGGAVAAVAWHPQGRLLAVACADHKIYLWDSDKNVQVAPPLEGHKVDGIIVRFNHAGDRLLSSDWSGLWRMWDTRTARQLLTQPARGAFLYFSSDDQYLGADTTVPKVRLFRNYGGQEFRSVTYHSALGHGYLPHAAAVDRHGRLLAIGRRQGVALVDIAQAKEAALLPIPDERPVRFDADDALLTFGQHGLLRWPLAVDSENGRQRYGPPQELVPYGQDSGIVVSGDGRIVVTPKVTRYTVVLHRDSGRKFSLGYQQDVRSCAISPDNRWIATGTHHLRAGAGAKVWDAQTGQHIKDLPVPGLCSVCFSPDGKWLLTGGGGCRLWAVGSWQEGPPLGGSVRAWGAFSPDGKLLALEEAPGTVHLLVPDSGVEVARLTGPEPTRLTPRCFTPDGAQLIAVGDDEAVHIFDLRALRGQLMPLGLDWAQEPYSPAQPVAAASPLEVEIDMGNLAKR
jgi:serine/threonine protein kinase/WD40 repeat protein